MSASAGIEWISSGRTPLDVGPEADDGYRTGGELYDQDAIRTLQAVAPVELRQFARPGDLKSALGPLRTARFVVSLLRHVPAGRLAIWEGGSLNYAKIRRDPSRRQVAVVHHLELEGVSLPRRILRRRVAANLTRLDVVVTVSEYWRSKLLALGASDVRVIHNPAPGISVDFRPQELAALDRRYGFAPGRPLVYLGTSQPKKGAVEAYRALASERYQFVVTGGEEIPELPVRRLELSARDYLQLLARCDVAVLMSRFPEGWCRTAAEAMYCGTPVVGSGAGGMRELLDRGGQLICGSLAELPDAVRRALDEREQRSDRGRRFAAGFTKLRFEQEWQELARSLLAALPDPPR